jgi:acyl dehydratase
MAVEAFATPAAQRSAHPLAGGPLLYDNVTVGMELPPFTVAPNRRQLVQWSGASENFAPIHFDEGLARRAGLPAVNIHGRLKAAFVAEMLTRWAGSFGALKKLAVSYRRMDFPDAVMTCKARVSDKRLRNGEGLVDCEIRIENEAGEATTIGTAVLQLPLRTKPGETPATRAP